MPAASFPFSFFVLPFSLFLPWGTETRGKNENRKTKIENSLAPTNHASSLFPFFLLRSSFFSLSPLGDGNQGQERK
jgi:hypothetical protein